MEKLLTENKTLQCGKRLHKNPYLLAVLVFGRDMSLDGTVWDSPRPWTRRCNVLGHLGHIYNV